MRPHVHSSLARATRVEGRGGPTASSDVNWDFSNKIKRYVISPCKIAARTARSLHLALCLNMHCSTTMPSPRGEIRVSTGDPYTPAHRAREITCRTFPRTSRATVLFVKATVPSSVRDAQPAAPPYPPNARTTPSRQRRVGTHQGLRRENPPWEPRPRAACALLHAHGAHPGRDLRR
eukprot:612044-Prorocentrum_minimum.AAC.8